MKVIIQFSVLLLLTLSSVKKGSTIVTERRDFHFSYA